MNGSRSLLTVFTILLLGGTVPGGEKVKALPPAKTPEEAVKNALTAMQAGDLDLLAAQLAQPTRGLLEFVAKASRAETRWRKLLDEKFGKDPKGDASDLAAELKQIKDLCVVEKQELSKDKFRLKVWNDFAGPIRLTREETLFAVREGDAWKLLPLIPANGRTVGAVRTGPGGKQIMVQVAQFDEAQELGQMNKLLERIKTHGPQLEADQERMLEAVRAGVYKTRQEPEKIMRALHQKFADGEKQVPPVDNQ